MIQPSRTITLSPGREVVYLPASPSSERPIHQDRPGMIYLNLSHPTRVAEAEVFLANRVREWALRSCFQLMKAIYYNRHSRMRKVFIALRKWTIASKFLRSQVDVQQSHNTETLLKLVMGHTASSMAKINPILSTESTQPRCSTPLQRQRKFQLRSTTPTLIPGRRKVQIAKETRHIKRSATPTSQPLAGVQALASHPLIRQLARAQQEPAAAVQLSLSVSPSHPAQPFGTALAKTSLHLPISEPVVQAPQFTRPSASPPLVGRHSRHDRSPPQQTPAALKSAPAAFTQTWNNRPSAAEDTNYHIRDTEPRHGLGVSVSVSAASSPQPSPSAAEIAYALSRGSTFSLDNMRGDMFEVPSGSARNSRRGGMGKVPAREDDSLIPVEYSQHTIIPPKRARSSSIPITQETNVITNSVAAFSIELQMGRCGEGRASRVGGSKLQEVLRRFRGALTPPRPQPQHPAIDPAVSVYSTEVTSPPSDMFEADTPTRPDTAVLLLLGWVLQRLGRRANSRQCRRMLERSRTYLADSQHRHSLLMLGLGAMRDHLRRARLQLNVVSHESWRNNALTSAFWTLKRSVTRANSERFLCWRGERFHRFVALAKGIAALHRNMAAARARVYEQILKEQELEEERSISDYESDWRSDDPSDERETALSPASTGWHHPKPLWIESDNPGNALGNESALVDDLHNSSIDQHSSSAKEPTWELSSPELSPPPAPRPALHIEPTVLLSASSHRPAVAPLTSLADRPVLCADTGWRQHELDQTALHAVRDSDSELSMFLSSDSEFSFESDPDTESRSQPVGPPPNTPPPPPPDTPGSSLSHTAGVLSTSQGSLTGIHCSPSTSVVSSRSALAFPFAAVVREASAYRRRTLLLQGLYGLQQWVLRAQSAATMTSVLALYRRMRQQRIALNTLRAKALL